MYIKLQWDDLNSSEEGHRIYRSTAPIDLENLPEPIAEIGADTTTYLDWVELEEPTHLYYRVAAFRGEEFAVSEELMFWAGEPYDPYWDNVVALLHFDEVPLSTDAKGKLWTITRPANVELSTEVQKFGNAVRFGRSGYGYISAGASPEHDLGAEDFTIEFWMYKPTPITQSGGLVDFRPIGTAPSNAPALFLDGTAGGRVTYYENGLSLIQTDPIPANTWIHIALCRLGNLITMYENGLAVGTTTKNNSFLTNLPITIGQVANGLNNNVWYFNGYLDEVRITKGVARYIEDFDPPTAPFPNVGPPPEPLPEVIGEPYGGGFYAGDIEYPDGQWYKLIVADVTADITGDDSRWKTSDTTTAGTDNLVDGVSNTAAMIAAGIELHPAASHCINHRGGGNEDWYMPSHEEMGVVYQNLGYSVPNCPPEFLSGGTQAFKNAYYSSSTQYGPTRTIHWIRHFSNGSASSGGRTATFYRVRPVRRLPFTP